MPIIIPENLPAKETLTQENIFVMGECRALHQDIRPLEIAILNLMPTKINTETQLLRLLGNSPLQVNITLVRTRSYESKNTPEEHMLTFYSTFDQIRENKYDGLIVTGAPVEHLPFEKVDYWEELCAIFAWRRTHVFSSFHICWGAQAALYYEYGIPKYPLPGKKFGVFTHRVMARNIRLLRGFDDEFYAPHSRHTEIRREDVERVPELQILAESREAGLYIVGKRNGRDFYVTGHSEYDPLTLKSEYDRDLQRSLPISIPVNYFPADDSALPPEVLWRGHAHLLYSNWLNYYVYQQTPYSLADIPEPFDHDEDQGLD